ncbi:hypothetical protein CANARDRAFT_22201 [[Candida] arabinofermentans NRRL YB-2248]|uniref:Uncharacterized protein n=1 Tax=[Candida] arabinofermentans NRRL YB-2248 TaxID=983967 RepID=A0A1E4T3Q7_9ASCO|nr:hypothetical protein CANARDRAFT_22201 [[Candida] arabinofermentans NRRL YB-2248]
MGWFSWISKTDGQQGWQKASRDEINLDRNNLDLPSDLNNYLESQTSKLSDREFKGLINKQLNGPQQDQDADTYTKARELLILSEMKHRSETQTDTEAEEQSEAKNAKQKAIPKKFDRLNSGQKTSTLSQDQINEMERFKTYIRNNDLQEAVLTNCTELQIKYFECIREKGRFLMHECTPLSDFHATCKNLQKMAFITFDYNSMQTIDQCEVAKFKIDKVFNRHFKTLDDTLDDRKYLEYSKDLKWEREVFYKQFNR